MIHPQSRLTLTEIIERRNPINNALDRPAYMATRKRVTSYAPDDKLIQVNGSLQWSHYGAEYLKDARNWWVIADLSNVVDPFEDLVFGATLRIPSIPRFLFEVLEGTSV